VPAVIIPQIVAMSSVFFMVCFFCFFLGLNVRLMRLYQDGKINARLFLDFFWPFLASNLRGFPALVSRAENKCKTFLGFFLNFFWPPEIPLAIRVAREGGSSSLPGAP